MKTYDLIVVGGGFAGTAAAISAARHGANVLLIEKTNCLGGAASNMLINPFMKNGFYIEENGERRFHALSQGLFKEICDNLQANGALSDEIPTAFHEEYLKLILVRMAIKAGVNLLFHAMLTNVEREGSRINHITVTTKAGTENLAARAFIDATGDADLAWLSHCPYRCGRESDNLCQPMTLCFRVVNVDIEKFHKFRPKINPLYAEFRKQGKVRNVRETVLLFDTMIPGMVHFNSTRVVKLNPLDPWDKTKAEIEAREQMIELFEFMKAEVDGFQSAQLLSTAMEIGVRESRMIDGEYVLNSDDLVSCRRFEDSIALGNYDIDIHNPEGVGTSHYFFPDGQYYTIPYRSLVPKGIDNLLVAGRCISATHEAQASIRIMPIVCCLGEAAGTAAALALQTNATNKSLHIQTLQNELIKQGALL